MLHFSIFLEFLRFFKFFKIAKKYNTGGSTSAGTVNSITPGNAVVVRDGGRFTSNGGEYYGRGFTIDDNGEKETVCAAVCLCNGAVAIVNAGDFYGKSCADVFSVAWGASRCVTGSCGSCRGVDRTHA